MVWSAARRFQPNQLNLDDMNPTPRTTKNAAMVISTIPVLNHSDARCASHPWSMYSVQCQIARNPYARISNPEPKAAAAARSS